MKTVPPDPEPPCWACHGEPLDDPCTECGEDGVWGHRIAALEADADRLMERLREEHDAA